MTALTHVSYVATAGQREFDVSFPYLDAAHVSVTVNGVSYQFEWISGTRVRLEQPMLAGDVVTLRRKTPLDHPLVEFTNGSNLTAEELNRAQLQILYGQQELSDLYGSKLTEAEVRLGDNLGVVTTPDALMDQLVQLALASETLAEFRTRIQDIDANAETIIEQTLRVDRVSNSMNVMNATTVALRTDFETLVGVVDALANLEDGTGLATIIQQEQDARIEGDTALAQTIGLIGSKNGNSTAFVLNLDTAKVSNSESLAQRLNALSAEDGDIRALVISKEAALVANAAAQASLLTGLTSRIGAAEANAITETNTRVSNASALAQSISLVDAKVAGANASITAEQTARVNGDSAIADTLALLGAKNGGGTAFILDLNKTMTNATTSLASRFSTFDASIGAVDARVTTEAGARVSGDQAISNTIALLGAKNANSTAFILDLNKVMANTTTSLGTRLSGIDASIAGANAAVVTETNARVSNGSALAQSISILNANVAGANATITSLQQTVSGPGGLTAKAGLSLDVNGYVTGWTLNNNGASGDMTVRADRFAVVTSSGTGLISPFTVTGSQVFIDNALIKNLTSQNLAADAIEAQHIKAGSIETAKLSISGVTTDRIDPVAIRTRSGSWSLASDIPFVGFGQPNDASNKRNEFTFTCEGQDQEIEFGAFWRFGSTSDVYVGIVIDRAEGLPAITTLTALQAAATKIFKIKMPSCNMDYAFNLTRQLTPGAHKIAAYVYLNSGSAGFLDFPYLTVVDVKR